jgi:hypothetical protein
MFHPGSWELKLIGDIDKYKAAIDANFGEGYTKRHPELVAACIQHAALGEIGEAVRDAACIIDPWLRVIAENMPR